MPEFIYNGPLDSVNIAGRHVDRGSPTRLEGRAADTARELPDFEELGSEPAKPKAAKPDGKPKSTRSSASKATRKSARPAPKAAPAKAEPATPIVSSDDPTPASTTIDVSDPD